ncbi:coiled-coil domain-containing protein 130 homolog [Eurosta solidaginis]|uniref:coiled-coil domain-containing protein 130 homolog n=1 Tax=Eurosta solidaginis TaxID=178769 RepID=UPI00353121CE
MGERKGQNKYYPPDYDPKKGGLNKFRGTHALRERARKIHLGIIIIRFEMPYNIWCDGCKNHIGMGVRYNAEKTKTGMYYSTPIYKFRMKCHLCDNHFEIQTDPGNLDYVILSGARRQENRWDPLNNEQIVPETKEAQKRLFDDPMYKLEHLAKDVKTGEDAKPILERLVDRNRNVWNDNYEANCRLRAEFRTKKKELKAQKELDDKLLARTGLDIALLPEIAQDKQMAALMMLQSKSAQDREAEKRLDILMKPALPGATKTTFGGLKRQKVLNTHLQFVDLGIKKKNETTSTVTATSSSENENCPEENITKSSSQSCSTATKIEHNNNLKTVEASLVDLPKSLALVCDYDSASETDNSN